MARDKKPGSLKVPLAGLGGFILGAATVLLVVYLYGQLSGRPPVPRTVSPLPPPRAPPAPPPAAPATRPPPPADPRRTVRPLRRPTGAASHPAAGSGPR